MSRNLSGQIRLECLGVGHALTTFEWVSDPVFRQLFLMQGAPDLEAHYEYFHKILSDESQRPFAIVIDERHAGNCGLKNIDLNQMTAELWMYIGSSELRGKGFGRAALDLLLKQGFESMQLSVIYLHVAKANSAARHLYESVGFQVAEITRPEWIVHGDTVMKMELRRSQ